MNFLADTSALIHAWRSTKGALGFRDLLARNDVRLADPVQLELLRGARSPAAAERLAQTLGAALRVPVRAAAWTLAQDTLLDLTQLRGGRHRGVSIADLLVAAVAVDYGLTVLHRDRDFDLIASVTGQPVQWFGARPA